MKRRDYLKEKRTKRDLFLIILFTFIFLYLIFSFGFQLIFNTSIFLSRFFNKKTPTPTSFEKKFYGKISVDDIPISTNSSQFIFSASQLNFDLVKIYLNNSLVKEIKNPPDIFSEVVDNLKIGENDFYLLGETSDKKYSKKTPLIKILYKNTKPNLEIIEPKENTTSKNYLTIKGKTDKEVFVKINDLPITVDANGNFQTTVYLKNKENEIKIQAIDKAGNIEEKILSIQLDI